VLNIVFKKIPPQKNNNNYKNIISSGKDFSVYPSAVAALF
jgi:hypothetical protein